MEGNVQIDTFRRIVETEEDLPNDDFKLIAVGFKVNRRSALEAQAFGTGHPERLPDLLTMDWLTCVA